MANKSQVGSYLKITAGSEGIAAGGCRGAVRGPRGSGIEL